MEKININTPISRVFERVRRFGSRSTPFEIAGFTVGGVTIADKIPMADALTDVFESASSDSNLPVAIVNKWSRIPRLHFQLHR